MWLVSAGDVMTIDGAVHLNGAGTVAMTATNTLTFNSTITVVKR